MPNPGVPEKRGALPPGRHVNELEQRVIAAAIAQCPFKDRPRLEHVHEFNVAWDWSHAAEDTA